MFAGNMSTFIIIECISKELLPHEMGISFERNESKIARRYDRRSINQREPRWSPYFLVFCEVREDRERERKRVLSGREGVFFAKGRFCRSLEHSTDVINLR